MHVHRSNRVERLLEALAQLVRRPAGSPGEPETIVVQGRGMERWLARRLARELGVWANPDFPFPRALVGRAFDAVLGESSQTATLEAASLVWDVATALPGLLERPAFAPLAAYLRSDEGGSRLLALSRRIARVFDQYVVYRPRMVLDWERGEDEGWQATLFRETVTRRHPQHVARRADAFRRALRAGAGPIEGLPRRVSLFGLSTLPPLYLGALAELSHRVEVHLFILSPSREYWADIRSRRERIRALLRADTHVAEELHLVEGHPLLASMGRLGRDLQLVLEDVDDYVESDADLYAEPGTDTMLHALQSDILHLRQRGPGGAPPLAMDARDAAIEVHSCHGPMRELQVLHDRLVDLFERDASLEPHDVIVMAPDIEAYAPLVEAVFGADAEERPRIPFCVADRAVRAQSEVVDALLRLLEVLGGRFGASEVLDLLGVAPIRARFGLDAAELDALRDLVEEARVCWGIDAAHRASFGQPADPHNTWRFGLDRLLLGHAMPAGGERLFGGALPVDDVEGASAQQVGRLADFAETLFAFHARAAMPMDVPSFCDLCLSLLRCCVEETDETSRSHRLLRDVLLCMAEQARAAGFDAAVDLSTFRGLVEERLSRTHASGGAFGAGLTFCQLVPMRSIPHRVVCLLGMDDDAYPRRAGAVSFDLVARGASRPGDRSTRDEDRQLFLEALLSARERLIITYAGQGIRDGRRRPPSVMVGELLDAVQESFTPATPGDAAGGAEAGGDAVADLRAALVLEHPLQPFSPRYFGADPDPRLFSYARAYCAGARTLVEERRDAPPFLTAPLPVAPQDVGDVTTDELERFFLAPTKRFLERRLGLYRPEEGAALEDAQRLSLDALSSWRVGGDLLRRTLEGVDTPERERRTRASGVLPPGTPGDCALADLEPTARAIARAAAPLREGGALAPLEVDQRVDGTRVTGAIRGRHRAGLVDVRFGRVGGRAELRLWVRHLLWSLVSGGAPGCSCLVGRPRKGEGALVVVFRPPDDPAALVADLLALYQEGQGVPLPLFEKASRAYAEGVAAGRPPPACRAAAAKAYEIDLAREPGLLTVYGEQDPTAQGFVPPWGGGFTPFASVAERLLRQLLEHREEVSP